MVRVELHELLSVALQLGQACREREREGAHELQSQVPHARNNHTCWPMQGDLSLELVYPDADRAGPRVLLLLHQHLYREWVWI